jgi:hypothetical protein
MTPKQQAAADRRRADRQKLREKLANEGAADLTAMLDKCGQEVRLVCVNCGCRRIAEQRCEKRWCPSCAYYIAVERVAKYQFAASKFQWPLFVTLTIRNTPDPEGLTRIKAMWGKMRRRKLIAAKVRSGIVGYEVTNQGKGWHPHIHSLLDCRWLALHTPEPLPRESASAKEWKCRAAATELETLWAEIAGQESASVKIRRGDARALVEVLKYSVKGSDLIDSPEPIAPLIRLMGGMRLMATFGAIRKEMKDADPEEETDHAGTPCEQCGCTGYFVPMAQIDRAFDTMRDARNNR